jgi:hypothetical protein
MLEARNALLSVAAVTDSTDLQEFWAAFAKRGAGINAIAPDRFSATNTPGLVESFDVGGALALQTGTLTDSLGSCDHDGYLDNGELGELSFSVRNRGSVALSETTATVSSTNPNVSFPEGNVVNVAIAQPFATTLGSIKVSLNGAAGLQQADFTISVNDPTGPG